MYVAVKWDAILDTGFMLLAQVLIYEIETHDFVYHRHGLG
jgi:hypothetical protein